MKQISALDDKVPSLTAKIVHYEECESFILGIVEYACEMLRCEILCDFFFSLFFLISLDCLVIPFVFLGTCLDFADEARQVAKRNAALEKASEGVDSLWSNRRRREAIVLL
jgi:hypothetical protein